MNHNAMPEPIINIIELDCRDARYQSGIARYLDILASQMPGNVVTYKIIFYHSPDFTEVRINPTPNELQIFYPAGFPMPTLYEAALAFIGNKLSTMQNLIVKSNCLGLESFAYMLRGRFYCRTIGILHCLPNHALSNPEGHFPSINPFRNMDHIILVCDAGVEYLNGVGNTRPYQVIRNGISRPVSVPRQSDGIFRFIWANGWARHKGLHRIIPAIRRVASTHRIEVIVLGGGADLDQEILSQISDLPIINAGLVTDADTIAQYYGRADCALFASYSEACSFAGIEAMANALPIVSTDAVGLAEMFGTAALYVKTGADRNISSDEFAELMISVIKNKGLRTKLSVAAYARYLRYYQAKKMAKDTLNLYRRLISNT